MLKVLKAWAAWPLWVQSLFVFGFAALTMVGAALPLTVVALLIAPYIGDLVALVVGAAVLVVCLVYVSIHNAVMRGQVRLQYIRETAPSLLFDVFCEIADRIGTLIPMDIENLVNDYGRKIGTAPVLCVALDKKQLGTAVGYEMLTAYKRLIQRKVDIRLCSGNYIFGPWIAGDALPALTVVDVEETPILLYVHIAIVYDSKSDESVRNYMSPQSMPTPVPTKKAPSIPIAYDKTLYADGVKSAIFWPYDLASHGVVIGSTGSGKTFAVKLWMHTVLTQIENSSITVCDFKADDFKFLLGRSGYHQFDACAAGLQDFYDQFVARQSGKDACRDFRLLVFDEWASYLQTLDKKTADAEIKKMTNLLMLGRAFNCHVLVSQQRGDAQYFSTARDNFGLVVALGNLSPESRDMFFRGYKDKIEPTQTRGTGYVSINGGEPVAIKVPSVNIKKKELEIAEYFTPAPPDDAGEA